MNHLHQLEQLGLRPDTVEIANSAARDVAPTVLQYAETGLKIVQVAAAVLGIVREGARMFCEDQPKTRRIVHAPTPPALPTVSVDSQDFSEIEDLFVAVNDTKDQVVHQGPPPLMSARGRLF